MHQITPLDRAIQQLGSQQALADALGIKSPSITGWRQSGRVPAERCAAIEVLTEGKVTRADLRPDLFGGNPPQRGVAANTDEGGAAQTDGVPVRSMNEAA